MAVEKIVHLCPSVYDFLVGHDNSDDFPIAMWNDRRVNTFMIFMFDEAIQVWLRVPLHGMRRDQCRFLRTQFHVKALVIE